MNNLKRTITELMPRFDSRKSFYGKAKILRTEEVSPCESGEYWDIVETLYSYETPVLYHHICTGSLKYNGTVVIPDSTLLSNTTLRHVKEYLKQHDLPCGTKQEIIKMYCNNGN